MFDQADKWFKIVFCVDQDDWLRVLLELRLGIGLEKFVERAKPAGQHRKALSGFEHLCLALIECFGHHDLGGITKWWFQMTQEVRDDAKNLTIFFGDAPRNFSHEADSSASKYQPKAVSRDQCSETTGGLRKGGIVAMRGATKYAYSRQGVRNDGCPPIYFQLYAAR